MQGDLAAAHAAGHPWMPEQAGRIRVLLAGNIHTLQVEGLGDCGHHKPQPWRMTHIPKHAMLGGGSAQADRFRIPPPPAVDAVQTGDLLPVGGQQQLPQCFRGRFLIRVTGGHHTCPPPFFRLFKYSRRMPRAAMAQNARSIFRWDSRPSLAILMPAFVGWRRALSMWERNLASPSWGKSLSQIAVYAWST